ncbi:MAG: riboflavin biosynthesis protein RibF [Candidatus Krumholzibacteriota bacterium]|nr:riboflavin biosynthesis protein RibF [Candidatus Krumholzibacteriota bacterium]
MRVYQDLASLRAEGPRRRAAALGVFDGVHRGHARILDALGAAVAREGLDESLVITFDPHPLAVVRPERAPRLLCTLDERLAALAGCGIETALVLPFTADLAATDYARFAREILVEALGVRFLVAGYDFHLGRGRRGSAEDMAVLGESLGFRVEVVTPCYADGRVLSSTRIRDDLAAGRLDAVREALGRPFRISGRVVRGRGRGRTLGFPTANLAPPPPEKLLPPAGVYLVSARPEGEIRAGLMNLGWAPTLKGEWGPEVHLLDWAGDLYGRTMDIDVWQWLRSEERFSDSEALAARIREDLARARRILASGLLT